MEKLYIEEMESRVAPNRFSLEIDGVMVSSGEFQGFFSQLLQNVIAWMLSNGYFSQYITNRFSLEIDGVM